MWPFRRDKRVLEEIKKLKEEIDRIRIVVEHMQANKDPVNLGESPSHFRKF